jgi:hypothetical protein
MRLRDLQNIVERSQEGGGGWEDNQNNPDLLKRKPTFPPWHPYNNDEVPPIHIPTGNPLFPVVPTWIPGQDHNDNMEDEYGEEGPRGPLTLPDGTIVNSDDGTVTFPDGMVVDEDGRVVLPDGTIIYPDGTRQAPSDGMLPIA